MKSDLSSRIQCLEKLSRDDYANQAFLIVGQSSAKRTSICRALRAVGARVVILSSLANIEKIATEIFKEIYISEEAAMEQHLAIRNLITRGASVWMFLKTAKLSDARFLLRLKNELPSPKTLQRHEHPHQSRLYARSNSASSKASAA